MTVHFVGLAPPGFPSLDAVVRALFRQAPVRTVGAEGPVLRATIFGLNKTLLLAGVWMHAISAKAAIVDIQ